MASFDVIVIGSGIAGAICAAKLAEQGRRVLILEAAQNGIGMGQRELFKRIWDPVPAKSWNTPYLKNPDSRFFPSPGPLTPDTSVYFDQPEGGSAPEESLQTFKGYYQRLVGGSTWAWRGNTPRMMPNDFRLKSRYFSDVNAPDGTAVVDWPLSYDDMKPWYLLAEQELGVSGNASEWEDLTPRDGAAYPMPAQPQSFSDSLLVGKLDISKVNLAGEDLPLRFITMAQARNSRPYDGRPACEGNHNCIPLCPTSAKYDASVHLRKAVAAGTEIRDACVVTRLTADESGSINAVFYKNWNSDDPQKEIKESAPLFVLAANPIETAKILLYSNLAGGQTPVVGKFLMDHVQGECLGKSSEPIYPFRGPQTITGVDSIRDGNYRSKFASFRITLGNDGWGRAGSPSSVVDAHLDFNDGSNFFIGNDFRTRVTEKLIRLVRLGFSTEQLPYYSNRVELSDETDALGIPRPRIFYRVDGYTTDALKEAYRVCTEIFASMGVQHVGEAEYDTKDWNTAAHPMGTCRMGQDPATSVVSRTGRCHAHHNLYVVGSSVFPTGSATNPALTIAALSLMAADDITKR